MPSPDSNLTIILLATVVKNGYHEMVIKFLPLTLAAIIFSTLLYFRGPIKVEIKKWQLRDSPVLSELTSNEYIDKILSSTGRFDPYASRAFWFNQEVSLPGPDLAERLANLDRVVLGQSTDQKWIEVDLNAQHLYAHEGEHIAFDFPISSGLPWMPTVIGEFRIWAKVRAQRMAGGSVANGTYYDLPNVPFVQYFYGGYSLHGAYWHDDFGHPRSHGCVNISIPNAEKLYYWTDPVLGSDEYARYNIDPSTSTKVIVHGTTPTNIY